MALEHDDAPLRWTAGVRLRRSVREARARRHPDVERERRVDGGDCDSAPPRHQCWRFEVLRRLPAQTAAEEGSGPAEVAAWTSGRCRPACTSSARRRATSPALRPAARPETGITRTRQAGMLDFELFKRVIDEAGPALVRVDFFNYGEAFLHKRAIEMCEYIKSRFPHIYLYSSTNGLAFTEESVAQAGPLRHRRSHVFNRRRPRRELCQIPAAR